MNGHKGKGVDFICAVKACHKIEAIAIDQRLHHHNTHRKQRLLDTGGNPQFDGLCEKFFIKKEFVQLNVDKVVVLVDKPDTENPRRNLGDNGRQCHTRYAHAQRDSEKQI